MRAALAMAVLVVVVVLLGVGAAASRGAEPQAPSWGPAQQVSGPTTRVWAPAVALGGSGDAVVAWAVSSGSTATILASYRPAGAPSWPQPVVVAVAALNEPPRVAMDKAGKATIAWNQSGERGAFAMAASRSRASGRWERPQQISPPGQVAGIDVAISTDAAGNLLAAWWNWDVQGVQTVYRPAGSTIWGPPALALTDAPMSESNWSIALGSDGAAVVAGVRSAADGVRRVVVAAIGAAGDWQPGVEVSAPLDQLRRPVAAVGGGSAVVAWAASVSGNFVVQAAARPRGVGWGAPTTLSFPDGNALSPAVGMDGAGNAVAIWDATVDAEASFLPAGGSWTRPVAVSPLIHYPSPRLAVSPSGGGFAVWGGYTDDGNSPLGAATFDPRRGWSAPVSFGEVGLPTVDSPAPVAVDDHGDGLVVWGRPETETGNDFASIQALPLDAGGPMLHAVWNASRPSIARAGGFLVCRPGSWTGTRPIRLAYSWLRAGRLVGTGQRHRLVPADRGRSLSCRVRATNEFGPVSATSAPLRVGR